MLKDLAPSRDLLRAWKAGAVSWKEYTERYFKEMSSCEKEIEELAEKARRGMVTLLCYEREGDPHCHRHLLKKLVEEKSSKC